MAGGEFGPYRLDSLLGRGGMGEVWRAYDTDQHRVVAIKLLLESLSADAAYRTRFEREARTAANLHEQHVIPIHRYGEIEGRLFIDMRLIVGEDLGKVLDREGALPVHRAVAVVSQVAAALDAAHAVGLVHRDVKPANVLLATTPEGAPDSVYLADFGIAALVDAEARLTLTGAAVGTPSYMAPERFTVGRVDHRADVYALGCLLHEMLTGEKPFLGDDVVALLHQHATQPPPRPTDVRPELPAAFDVVVAAALAKDPDERFPSAGALAAAARRATTAKEPAPPPRPAPRPTTSATTVTGPALPTDDVTPVRRDPAPGRHRGMLAIGVAILVVVALVVTYAVTLRRPVSPAASAELGRIDSEMYGSDVVVAQLNGAPVLVAGTGDRAVEVWDAATRTSIGRTPKAAGSVQSLAVAELDGQPVVVSGGEQTLQVWDLASRQPVGAPIAATDRPITAVATARLDGRAVILAGDQGGSITVWDLATHERVGRPMTGYNIVSNILSTQLDGRTVVIAAGSGATVRAWDLTTRQEIGRTFSGPITDVYAVALTELDGRPVLVASSSSALWVWDLGTGAPIGAPLTGTPARSSRSRRRRWTASRSSPPPGRTGRSASGTSPRGRSSGSPSPGTRARSTRSPSRSWRAGRCSSPAVRTTRFASGTPPSRARPGRRPGLHWYGH
ncbi:WD40 repeat domain-containing serine/threonine protein kinase [Pseudonocardia sp. CA-107938]|uniref:WD40 repeat domain-containing serine/threonine protein kinase n=1 Tax=Pseudonocardia sp. CA-107938 TaxID=3240021 RepID=UPI003D8D1E9E